MPKYLSSSIHPVTGSDRLSIRAHEKVNRARLGLWCQYYHWDTKAEADALIQWAKEVGVTDLFLLPVSTGASPYTLLGYAAACSTHVTATRYDGMYPMEYMAANCIPLGIRVHAWFPMFQYNYWHNPSTSFLNSPGGSTYQDTTSSGGQMWEIFDATARSIVVDALKSFAESNRGVGIHLDYIRADGTSTMHTHTDITNLVSEIRTAIPGHELSVCSVAGLFQEGSGSGQVNQRPRDWAANQYVDTVVLMGYFYGWLIKGEQAAQISAGGKGVDVLVGFSAETFNVRTNDTASRLQMFQQMGFRHFSLFDYDSTRWNQSGWKDLAIAIHIRNNIAALHPNMGDIRKLTINQGTNVIINVGGTDHTVTWAQLGLPSEADPGDRKANAESTVGFSLKPFIFGGTSTLWVGVGEWYST